jgi:DNA-binding GntR family transcriptional regulator
MPGHPCSHLGRGTVFGMDYRPDSAIDRDIPTPVSEQLAGILRARLASGVWQPGRRFASEPTLAAEFGMSRNTVRKAISALVNDGLLKVVPSAGTFVATLPPTAQDPD